MPRTACRTLRTRRTHQTRPRPASSSHIAGMGTHGDQIRADLTGELPLAADLTTVAAAELDLHPGVEIWATVKATQTHAYPV